MIPKNSARICWEVMLLVLLLIIPGMGHSSNYPPWLQANASTMATTTPVKNITAMAGTWVNISRRTLLLDVNVVEPVKLSARNAVTADRVSR